MAKNKYPHIVFGEPEPDAVFVTLPQHIHALAHELLPEAPAASVSQIEHKLASPLLFAISYLICHPRCFSAGTC